MASKKPDSSLLVLREIRDELKEIRTDLKDTNTRVAALERYVPEVEMRLATAIASMAGTLGEVRELLRGEDRQRMRAFEQRLEALERKTG